MGKSRLPAVFKSRFPHVHRLTATRRSEFATTLQIIPVVFFTFICYLTIGIPLAVLPGLRP